MYQVVVMYGDNEPWWFFEDWQNDIEDEQVFDSLEAAENYYIKKWQEFSSVYAFTNSKPNYLAAFWNEGDERWCDECDEDLQQYKGLALLENYQSVTFEDQSDLQAKTNHCGKVKCCSRSLVEQ